MPTTRQRKQSDDVEHQPGDALNALIGEQVLRALGAPADLLMVQVRPLWDGRYRVNVFVGPDVTSARVANSYFLTADDDGTIGAAAPPITKQY